MGRDKEDTSNKTIKGHQKTALEQTISHMASGTQDEEPRRKNLKQGRILQWQHPHLLLIRRFAREESKKQRRKLQWQHGHPHLLLIRFVREESKKKRRKLQWQHGHPHLLLISRLSEKKAKRKDVTCNDSTVTHTCSSFVHLSEKRHVSYRSVFMNVCSMSVWYTVFGNWQKYEYFMSVTTTFDMFYICSRVRYANFDLKRTV